MPVPGQSWRCQGDLFVSIPSIRRLRRIDKATILYLMAVAGLVSLSGFDTMHRILLVCIHLFAAVLILFLPRLREKVRNRPIVFLLDWYPALAFPLLYKQVEFLAGTIGDWGLTQTIQRWELQIFNVYPSLWLGEAFPSIVLSEYLHFCYFCYILLLPAIGGFWYFRGNRKAFHDLLFLLAVTYYLSFIIFILYPVDSPYYLFLKLDEPAANGPFYKLVHFISERGGARGGAFPSLHVSVSTVILLTVQRFQRRFAYFLLPVVGGIYMATLYGRFHYALDVLAGIIFGTLVVLVFRFRDSVYLPDESAQFGTEA